MRTAAVSISSLLWLLLLHICAGVRIPARITHTDNNYLQHQHHLQRRNVDSTEGPDNHSGKGATDSIPMQFYEELDNVTDIYEFIERFVINKQSIDPQLGLQGNQRQNVERAASVLPRPATCQPDSTIVPLLPLHPSEDTNVHYYPKCTRVKRCGGCCNSELMSCQPTVSEVINFELVSYRYGEDKRLEGKEIVPIEQHLKCKCGCRIKAEDCNSYQIYRSELCRCSCTNDDEREKCLSQEHKVWDEKDCRCVCHDTQDCTTGTIFDESQCKCVSPSNSNVPAILDRRRFIIKAIPVEPDNSTIYNV